MKAFMVSVNGRHICTAGIGLDGVLSTILSWAGGEPHLGAEGEFHLHIGGLDCRTDEHLNWPAPEVAVGDEITIRIIEAEHVDAEGSRRKAQREPAGGG